MLFTTIDRQMKLATTAEPISMTDLKPIPGIRPIECWLKKDGKGAVIVYSKPADGELYAPAPFCSDALAEEYLRAEKRHRVNSWVGYAMFVVCIAASLTIVLL